MELEFIIRIGVCLFLSILIGSERQYRNGVVGLRTNVLVAIGSFMFNYVTFGVSGNHDFTRMGAGIVSGIGFLGAGIIIQENNFDNIVVEGITDSGELLHKHQTIEVKAKALL